MPVCDVCSKPLDTAPVRNRVTCSQACRNTRYRRRVLAERDELRSRHRQAAALLSA